MEEKKLWYVITCHHKHVQLNEESTFLVRIVKELDDAKQLMQSIYEDAEAGRTAKFGGKYSNPKWLDEKHLKLQITYDAYVGWVHSTTILIYQLTDEWNFNIFNDRTWILD